MGAARYELSERQTARARAALFVVFLEAIPEHVYISFREFEELLNAHDALVAGCRRRIAHVARRALSERAKVEGLLGPAHSVYISL